MLLVLVVCVMSLSSEGQASHSGLVTRTAGDNHLCEASLDPYIVAYGGARSRMTLPCRHCLSTFVTPNTAADNQDTAHCYISVYGLNQITDQGVFYEKGVEIDITLGDFTKDEFVAVHIKKLGLALEGLYKYQADNKVTVSQWGEAVHEVFKGITIFCIFNPVDNFAELHMQGCGVVIKFRPFNLTAGTEVQKLKPGITIQAPADAFFERQYGGFPASLCGLPEDDTNLYRMARGPGLPGTAAALSYELLIVAVGQGTDFFRGAYDDQCYYASFVLDVCLRRERAVGICNRLLSDRSTLSCLLSKEVNPMETFIHCLEVCCFQSRLAAELYTKALQGCQDVPQRLLKIQEK